MRGKPNYFLGFAVLTLLASAVVGGFFAKDRLERRAAEPAVRAAWAEVRTRVDARMDDQHPLEFGAVWSTHGGRICGLVNGGSSFGGLTGMIPFYREGEAIRYSLDTEQKLFASGWRECLEDTWLELHPGSYQTGFCATRRGQARCQLKGAQGPAASTAAPGT